TPTMSRSVLPGKKVATSSCCAPAGEAATLHRTSRASSVFFIAAERQLELIGQGGGRFFARHDRNDFEVDEVGPLGDPLLKERDVTAFHQLETTAEVGRNPAVHEFQAIRGESTPLAESLVHRLGVLVPELLDDHEQHNQLSFLAASASGRRAFFAGL